MFKFLKLWNSDSGDARRHVPFASIINKPLFVLIAFVFSFVAIVPVKVYASAVPPLPEVEPIYDTSIYTFQESYNQLSPAAQAAASILFGAYVLEYAGFADFGTVFKEPPADADVWERLEFTGRQIVDTLFLPINAADQLVLSPLIELGQGIVNKVKNVNSVQGFTSDILDAEQYGLRYSPDIGFSINQVLAMNGGLFNWQFKQSPFSTTIQYDAFTNLSTVLFSSWNEAFASIHGVRVNQIPANPSAKNQAFGNNLFGIYHNVFLNTSNNTIYLCDDSGNLMPTIHNAVPFIYILNSSGYSLQSGSGRESYSPVTFNPNLYSDYTSIIDALYNGSLSFSTVYFIFLQDFVENVYFGSSWDNREILTNETDLGFTQTDSLQYLNPIKDAIFDLKGMVEQIVDAQPDSNYELPLKPIIYNITQVNGSPLTAEDLEGISFNVTPPESGIDVPANVFLSFFDDGKGFISYMWYMTKPLVAYTRSLLDVLTFDPVDGFNASGPGYFILGVAGLGLIGGVIVKFLL